MYSSLYFIIASASKLNWHENKQQAFYYDNPAVVRLNQNDLVFFIFPEKTIYAVKRNSRIFNHLMTFQNTAQLIDVLNNINTKRSILYEIHDKRLIESSIKHPLRPDEILPLLYSEILRVFSNIKSDIFTSDEPFRQLDIENFFDADTDNLFQTLKEFGKYNQESIFKAIKILEPENYELAEFKSIEHKNKSETLLELKSRYREIFNKSGNLNHVFDFLPKKDNLINAKNGLLAAGCFNTDKIIELLREVFPADIELAIEQYIAHGQNTNNELLELESQIKEIQKSLGIEYIEDEIEEHEESVAPIEPSFPVTENCPYTVNQIYSIDKVYNLPEISLEYNTFLRVERIVKIYYIKSWIIENTNDEFWVIKGEGKSNSDSQHFGQNCNSWIRNGSDVYLFEIINQTTCRFKGVARYQSHKEVIETESYRSKRRTVIHFSLKKV